MKKGTILSVDMAFLPENNIFKTATDYALLLDHQGIIIKTGIPDEVAQYATANGFQVERISGGAIIPNLCDTHDHPALYGMLSALQAGFVFGSDTLGEMITSLSSQVTEGNLSMPKIFLGHNTSTITLNREILDEISPGRPIAVFDLSLHGCTVNSAMLSLVSEKVLKNMRGILDKGSGILKEDFALLALRIAESFLQGNGLAKGIKYVLDSRLTKGVADVHEMYIMTYAELVALLTLRRDWDTESLGEFPVRIMFLLPALLQEVLSKKDELRSEGLLDFDREKSLLGIKGVHDGSIGSHTAYLDRAYADQDTYGMEFVKIPALLDVFSLAADCGIENVAIHAIGDRAVANVAHLFQSWKAAAEAKGLDTNKFRIEHCEISGDPQTLGALKDIPWISSQANFIIDYWTYGSFLGARVETLCPHRDFLDRGIGLMHGSDGMPEDPIFGVLCAMLHPVEAQRLTLPEALAGYTITPAMYEGNGERCLIEEGRTANFTLLSPELYSILVDPVGIEISDLADSTARDAKMSELNQGIRRIYRTGKLVLQND